MTGAAIFGKWSKTAWVIAGLFLVGLVGYVDYATGNEIGFSPFYLIPIVLVTWFTNAGLGIVTSVVSAAIWMSADILAGATYSNDLIPFWNTLIRLTFFLITVSFLKARKTLELERAFAWTDYV